MKTNRRKLTAILLLLCLTLAALTGCSGGKDNNAIVAMGKTAWAATGRTDTPMSAAYMHFTSADSLNTTIAQPDPTVALVPMSGYVLIFPPVADGKVAFSGLQAVFLGEDGKVISRLSYDDLYSIYEGSQSGAYLDAANYLAALYLDSVKNGTAAGTDERIGSWYTVTDAQVTEILKQ